ncbi:haloacid dehalogenase [Bacterioplanes sanyensis]|uniref:HAD family hydrolase n=1 Tax=Bacterioplanes sanyensis TaxID=1249553 RepID=UPI0016725B43|nr:HAD-IA family hydrolase [Bacterioplanes sanyensis]GGY53166.1 haloacid dehalogenase [Bacterioplanes sanyensis]
MQPDVICLDLDHTLWDTDPVIVAAEHATYDWIATHCPTAAECYTLDALREYKNAIAESYPQWRHQVSKLRREVLRRVFLQAGLQNEQAELMAHKAFAVFYHARSQVNLFDGASDALQQLAQYAPLVAVTNGNADLSIAGIDHLFSGHFSAEKIGAAKPEPDLFLAALEHCGASAANSVHVGDHQEQDIVAAARLGMKTVWVNLSDAPWAESECRPDQEINHLSQLPAAIAAI